MSNDVKYQVKNGKVIIPGFHNALMENIRQYPTYDDLRKAHSVLVNDLLNSKNKGISK